MDFEWIVREPYRCAGEAASSLASMALRALLIALIAPSGRAWLTVVSLEADGPQ
jgi:hypothetical protein